jgi:hypothetical protein
VVVDAIDTLVVGNTNEITLFKTNPADPYENRVSSSYAEFKVSFVVLMPPATAVKFVVAALLMPTEPKTSQSPAVKEMLVIVFPVNAVAAVVSDTADPTATDDETTSPTLPALALLFVVVPTIPAV